MSANKFKVGDKVKVRKGLVADEYYGHVRCSSPMARMGGKVLTINHVTSRYYGVDEYEFYWSDEMLEPVRKTLDNLCAGDFICDDYIMRKVLVAINGCYLLSKDGMYDVADGWYTAEQLKMDGFEFFDPQVKTIEINGKKYKKVDVEEAIKDLEVVE